MDPSKPPSPSNSRNQPLLPPGPLTEREIYGERMCEEWGTEIRRRENRLPKPPHHTVPAVRPEVSSQRTLRSAQAPVVNLPALEISKRQTEGDEGDDVLSVRANERVKGVQIFRPFGMLYLLSCVYRQPPKLFKAISILESQNS